MPNLSDLIPGRVPDYIEVAQVYPLSSTYFQFIPDPGLGINSQVWKIDLNRKLYDTGNLGTFTAANSGQIIIPSGRWSYKIVTSILNPSGNSSYFVGMSAAELNDCVVIENGKSSQVDGRTITYEIDGEFESSQSLTLSLVTFQIGGLGAYWIGLPAFNFRPQNNTYGVDRKENYKRASLKLWKLK